MKRRAFSSSTQGVALVLVLAFVVLLSGVVALIRHPKIGEGFLIS